LNIKRLGKVLKFTISAASQSFWEWKATTGTLRTSILYSGGSGVP